MNVVGTGRLPGVHEGVRCAAVAAGWFARFPGVVAVGLIRVYQRFVSPLTPPTCRFFPCCSQYAVMAVQTHGLLRGGWLTARRLGRCHPWTAGGVDDVPLATSRMTLAHPEGPDRARSSLR